MPFIFVIKQISCLSTLGILSPKRKVFFNTIKKNVKQWLESFNQSVLSIETAAA